MPELNKWISRMGTYMRNKLRIIFSMTAVASIALAAPGTALADANVGDPGLQRDPVVTDWLMEKYGDDGPIPVQFWAEGTNNCELELTVVNRTNSPSYRIDYVIDNEDPTKIPDERAEKRAAGEYTYNFGAIRKGPYAGLGEFGTRTMGRLGSVVNFDGPGYGTAIEGSDKKVPLKMRGEPVITEETVNLHELPGLPNPTADAHTVTYQQILGPDHGLDGVQSKMPVFTTEVTGCATSTGSLGSASLANPFGSLNSLSAILHGDR